MTTKYNTGVYVMIFAQLDSAREIDGKIYYSINGADNLLVAEEGVAASLGKGGWELSDTFCKICGKICDREEDEEKEADENGANRDEDVYGEAIRKFFS